MSTRTSSLSMRTISPSTMSPSLKSIRTLSSTGTISPFSSRKKSFMVSSRDAFLVVSVMYQLLSFTLLAGADYTSFRAGCGLSRILGVERFDPSPALPDLDLDLQGWLEVVGRDHPVGG